MPDADIRNIDETAARNAALLAHYEGADREGDDDKKESLLAVKRDLADDVAAAREIVLETALAESLALDDAGIIIGGENVGDRTADIRGNLRALRGE